jgi:hypothetical protein
MFKCQICGKSTPTSQGLAGHKWLKHGGKTRQEGVLVQGAAQLAQAAQSQGLGSPGMIQVPASYLAQLQQQAQQAQPAQQGQGLGGADRVRGAKWNRTVKVDPFVEDVFDYFKRELDYDSETDLSDFITECVREFLHQNDIRVSIPV